MSVLNRYKNECICKDSNYILVYLIKTFYIYIFKVRRLFLRFDFFGFKDRIIAFNCRIKLEKKDAKQKRELKIKLNR